jgi:hypothetical protein
MPANMQQEVLKVDGIQDTLEIVFVAKVSSPRV